MPVLILQNLHQDQSLSNFQSDLIHLKTIRYRILNLKYIKIFLTLIMNQQDL